MSASEISSSGSRGQRWSRVTYSLRKGSGWSANPASMRLPLPVPAASAGLGPGCGKTLSAARADLPGQRDRRGLLLGCLAEEPQGGEGLPMHPLGFKNPEHLRRGLAHLGSLQARSALARKWSARRRKIEALAARAGRLEADHTRALLTLLTDKGEALMDWQLAERQLARLKKRTAAEHGGRRQHASPLPSTRGRRRRRSPRPSAAGGATRGEAVATSANVAASSAELSEGSAALPLPCWRGCGKSFSSSAAELGHQRHCPARRAAETVSAPLEPR